MAKPQCFTLPPISFVCWASREADLAEAGGLGAHRIASHQQRSRPGSTRAEIGIHPHYRRGGRIGTTRHCHRDRMCAIGPKVHNLRRRQQRHGSSPSGQHRANEDVRCRGAYLEQSIHNGWEAGAASGALFCSGSNRCQVFRPQKLCVRP